MAEALDFELVLTRQQRIAVLAKQSPQMAFTSLNHHLDIWLAPRGLPAYAQGWCRGRGRTDGRRIRGAPGGKPPVAFGAGEVRHVPGAAGATGAHSEGERVTETRPIGIPTLEDKVLQRAIVMLLEPIYEQDFHGRLVRIPARTIGAPSVGKPVEADDAERRRMDSGSGYPKVFRHAGSRSSAELLQRRIRDGVVLRLIGKWLNAGVMEAGMLSVPGSRQPAGRGDYPAGGQRLSCTTCWTYGLPRRFNRV